MQFAESKPFPKSIRTDSVRLLEPTELDSEREPENLLRSWSERMNVPGFQILQT